MISKNKKSQEPPCMGCGMQIDPHEYHPYGACLMFKSSKDGEIVRDNLEAIMAYGEKGGRLGVK